MVKSLLGLDVVAQRTIKSTSIVVASGSVLAFTGSAIVNAANESCLGGGGVDGAITDAGGQVLHLARLALPVLDKKQTRCRTGDAVVTIGGDLKAEWCIHAVGPNYRMRSTVEEGDEELRSAYFAVMREAEQKKLKSVAFSLLSAGVFRGSQSLENVLQIGLATVAEKAYPELELAVFCGFTSEEIEVLGKGLEKL